MAERTLHRRRSPCCEDEARRYLGTKPSVDLDVERVKQALAKITPRLRPNLLNELTTDFLAAYAKAGFEEPRDG